MNNMQLYSDYIYTTLPTLPSLPPLASFSTANEIAAHGQEALNTFFAAADLSARNIKCVTNDGIFINGENLAECFKNSKSIYAACKDLSNSDECQTAKQTYKTFLERMNFWSTNKWSRMITCGSVPSASQWYDCSEKHANWKNACGGSNLHKDECIKAENILKDGLKNGFKEASWGGFNWGIDLKGDCEKAVKSITGSTTSTANEVKRAYKQKALKAHPDRGGNTEQMQKLNEANDKAVECFKNKILG